MTMKGQVLHPPITVPDNAQKILLLLDGQGLSELQPRFSQLGIEIIELFLLKGEKGSMSVTEERVQHTSIEVNQLEPSEQKIEALLLNQKMGTYIIVGCGFELASFIKNKAIEAGFSEQEVRVSHVGYVEAKLFCVKCYHYNRFTDEKTIVCDHCQSTLDVSKHYSRVKGAYLGYIAL